MALGLDSNVVFRVPADQPRQNVVDQNHQLRFSSSRSLQVLRDICLGANRQSVGASIFVRPSFLTAESPLGVRTASLSAGAVDDISRRFLAKHCDGPVVLR